MSDEEHQFESKVDAGASKTYRQQAGTVRKNDYLVIKNCPCKWLISSYERTIRFQVECWVAPQPSGFSSDLTQEINRGLAILRAIASGSDLKKFLYIRELLELETASLHQSIYI